MPEENNPPSAAESNVQSTAHAIAEITKAVPIYPDAIQPAAKELGKSLETVAKTINLVLMPLSLVIWKFEGIRDSVMQKLSERLKDVPPEKMSPPPAFVAGPTMEALRFTAEHEDLQQLYANLLATSINTDTVSKAHPAFVDIIKQMSPDEAKIVAVLSIQGAVHKIDVRYENNLGRGIYVLQNFTALPFAAGARHPEMGPVYLSNLNRLGLLELRNDYTLDPIRVQGVPSVQSEPLQIYELLEKFLASPSKLGLPVLPVLPEGQFQKNVRGAGLLTPLGRQFCEACVSDECRAMLPIPEELQPAFRQSDFTQPRD